MRPTKLALSVTTALIMSLLVASPAIAESVPSNPCTTSWWMANASISWDYETSLPIPTIALPVMWNGDTSKITEADRTAVAIEVRDPQGAVVPGTFGVGFFDGPWQRSGLSYTGWGRPDLLDISAWWRPQESLPAGRYTIHTIIPSPTNMTSVPGGAPQNCPYADYAFDQTFEVQPELPKVNVDVDYSLVVQPTEYVTHSTDCSDRAEIAFCPSHPGICCWSNDGYTHTVRFAWTNLPRGWSFYHVLSLQYDLIGYPYGQQSILWHPFPHQWEGSDPYILEQSFNPAPWQLPLPPELCARGHVVDIVDGSISFEFDGCVQTDNATRTSAQVLHCDDAACAELAGVPRSDDSGGEISDVSNSTEGEVADPGPDGYSPGCSTVGLGPPIGLIVVHAFGRRRKPVTSQECKAKVPKGSI